MEYSFIYPTEVSEIHSLTSPDSQIRQKQTSWMSCIFTCLTLPTLFCYCVLVCLVQLVFPLTNCSSWQLVLPLTNCLSRQLVPPLTNCLSRQLVDTKEQRHLLPTGATVDAEPGGVGAIPVSARSGLPKKNTTQTQTACYKQCTMLPRLTNTRKIKYAQDFGGSWEYNYEQ